MRAPINKTSKERQRKRSQESFGRTFVFYSSIIFITAGIVTVGVISFLSISSNSETTRTPLNQKIIGFQRQVPIVVNARGRDDVLHELHAKRASISSRDQSITVFPFVEKAGGAEQVSPTRFMELVGPSTPDPFLDQLVRPFIYGVFNDTNDAFLILTTRNSPQTIQASLRAWEKQGLFQNMGEVLYQQPPDLNRATATNSSIQNRAVRVLTAPSLPTTDVLAYMFFRSNIVVFAPTRDILERLYEVYQTTQRSSSQN